MAPTRDHVEIRRWAEKHGAVPAEIKPAVFDSEPSVLHFLFGAAAKNGTPEIQPITWESFFARFDLLHLSMVFADRGAGFALVRVEQAQSRGLPH